MNLRSWLSVLGGAKLALLILAVCGTNDVVDLNRLIYLLLTIQLNRLTAF
nr:hypothetical protein [Klebsiella pneumoniae]